MWPFCTAYSVDFSHTSGPCALNLTLPLPPSQILVKVMPIPAFRIYQTFIRGLNNVIGGECGCCAILQGRGDERGENASVLHIQLHCLFLSVACSPPPLLLPPQMHLYLYAQCVTLFSPLPPTLCRHLVCHAGTHSRRSEGRERSGLCS